MAKPFQFRFLTMLIVVTLICIGIGIYFQKNRPGQLSIRLLSGETLISHDDILFVDWDSQEFDLRKGLKSQLHKSLSGQGLIGGIPFELCIGDEIIYAGRITSSFSSFGFEGYAIDLMPTSPADDTIAIQWGYPVSPNLPHENDIRFKHRKYISLLMAGKLTKQDGE